MLSIVLRSIFIEVSLPKPLFRDRPKPLSACYRQANHRKLQIWRGFQKQAEQKMREKAGMAGYPSEIFWNHNKSPARQPLLVDRFPPPPPSCRHFRVDEISHTYAFIHIKRSPAREKDAMGASAGRAQTARNSKYFHDGPFENVLSSFKQPSRIQRILLQQVLSMSTVAPHPPSLFHRRYLEKVHARIS